MQIDNHLAENTMCLSRPRLLHPSGSLRLAGSAPPEGFDCPTALGKKNWLFIGNPRATARKAPAESPQA